MPTWTVSLTAAIPFNLAHSLILISISYLREPTTLARMIRPSLSVRGVLRSTSFSRYLRQVSTSCGFSEIRQMCPNKTTARRRGTTRKTAQHRRRTKTRRPGLAPGLLTSEWVASEPAFARFKNPLARFDRKSLRRGGLFQNLWWAAPPSDEREVGRAPTNQCARGHTSQTRAAGRSDRSRSTPLR